MKRQPTSQVTTGAVLVVIGLVLLAGQLQLFSLLSLRGLWPVALIALGVAQLVGAPVPGEGRRGLTPLIVGVVLLLHTLRILPVWDSWPLFIVAFGVSLLAGRRSCQTSRQERPHVS